MVGAVRVGTRNTKDDSVTWLPTLFPSVKCPGMDQEAVVTGTAAHTDAPMWPIFAVLSKTLAPPCCLPGVRVCLCASERVCVCAT
jgi:hypothetical protein